jgi:ATP-dependent Clp protease ATP-binding subunit ClpA
MYEHFEDRARQVVDLAQQEARRFSHEYVGTEHLLLSLVQEVAGVAADVLRNLNVRPDRVRREVERVVQVGESSPSGTLPQTPRAKKALEYALDEARRLDHDSVGTEHLLLGLLREQDGVAARVLATLGVQLDVTRQAVLKVRAPNPSSTGIRVPQSKEAQEAEVLSQVYAHPVVREMFRLIDAALKERHQSNFRQDFEKAAVAGDQEADLRASLQSLIDALKRNPTLGLPEAGPEESN